MDFKKETLALLNYHECETVKFLSILPSSRIMAQLISAFANTEGGYILLGVDSDKRVIGLSQDSRVDKIMENSLNALSILPNMQQQYVLHQGKKLYVISIEKSETLILVENMVYKRIGTTVMGEKVVQPIVSEKKEAPIKQKILFLEASPTDEVAIKSKAEFKTIKERLRRNPYFELLAPELDMTIKDFIDAMNQNPQIVHFAGHGAQDGIIISTENNLSQLMPISALQRLFKHRKSVYLVVLNSCYSEAQAKVISEFGIHVIGMTDVITNAEAIDFSYGLYNDLSEGRTIQESYSVAMAMIEVNHPAAVHLFKVWKDGKLLNW